MFGVKHYSDQLEALAAARGVATAFHRELVHVDVPQKLATFKNVQTGELCPPERFDLLHVAPHMSAPRFIRASPLANAAGWLDVHPATLQAAQFPNVFGLGDCTSTPNSKTAAAITSQAPVLVHNLAQAIEGKPLDGVYHGYASCPLIVSKNKVILAEFGYGGKLMETFNPDTGKFPLCWLGQDGAL
jgi:sulfide:quinone oxidoreductase